MQWNEALSAYFGVALTGAQQAAWFAELTQACRDVCNDELVAAIRDASFEDRDKYGGKPTLKDVRMWVFIRRKKQRQNIDEARSECEGCDNGWFNFRRVGGQYHDCPIAIPCVCSAGMKIVEADGNYTPAQLDAFASCYRDEMRRLAEEAPAVMEASKQRISISGAISRMASGFRA